MENIRKISKEEYEFACRIIHIDPNSSFAKDIDYLKAYAMQMLKPMEGNMERYESSKQRYFEMIEWIEAYHKLKS